MALERLGVIALLCAVSVVACNREPRPAAKLKSRQSSDAAPRDAGAARQQVDPPKTKRPHTPIPQDTTSLVVVVTPDWNDSKGKIARFERKANGAPWKRLASWQPTVIGHAGLGWGLGLHKQPDSGPTKREGDGRSSAGVFDLGPAYGYHKKTPARGWTYHRLDENWGCVDDPKRPDYNTITPSHAASDPKFRSAERMRRSDELYRWVVAIEHNGGKLAKPSPGAGSCIFFHVWRDLESPTVGCAALPMSEMEELIDWLEPGTRPVAVLLPRDVYSQLRQAWQLPSLEGLASP